MLSLSSHTYPSCFALRSHNTQSREPVILCAFNSPWCSPDTLAAAFHHHSPTVRWTLQALLELAPPSMLSEISVQIAIDFRAL